HADSRITEVGTPQLVVGVNVRALPIGPEEAFVLSRIDGVSSEADLAAATNLQLDTVARIVRRLCELGAVTLDAGPRAAEIRPFRATPTPTRSGAYRIGPITETQEARASLHPAAAVENAAELAEVVDLEREQKLHLLELYARLESASHYELLGIEPLANDKAVRAAYYELVRLYHPDRFFGKNLGSYKPKLAKLFARITDAYEALHHIESRAEYDKYLRARRRTLDFERAFFNQQKQAAEVANALAQIEHAAQAGSPPIAPPANTQASSVAPRSGATLRHSLAPPSDAERRRTLARKLGLPSAPPPRVSSAPPPSASAHAAEELKRRYDQRRERARVEQHDHYVALAEDALGRGDLATAANALRIACSIAPENTELAARLGELENRAAAELWEAYVERGKYAAFEGRHAEAAESFERAAIGHPSATHFERAAFHLLEAGGDAKRAVQLGKQAVALAPHHGKCRLTLAQAYFAGKMRESGLAELERARALEPDLQLIKDFAARVRRGEI
ncbi:MAG TPA: DnaJ domain-containing protein, partial [Polyangiaceae bacterium]